MLTEAAKELHDAGIALAITSGRQVEMYLMT
jgi:hypothetical protein